MKNMDLSRMKVKDLGEMTSKAFENLGEEIEDKKQDAEDMGKRKLSELGKKIEQMGE